MLRFLIILFSYLNIFQTILADDRLPPIPENQITFEQQDAINEMLEESGYAPRGPWIPLLRSPEVHKRARAMGDYLRYESSLIQNLREFLILLTARYWTQNYIWYAHYPIALEVGINNETVEDIMNNKKPDNMTPAESTLYDFFLELNDEKFISEETYSDMISKFGEKGLIDAIGIIGYYTLLAMTMNAAQTNVPEGDVPILK